MAGFGISHRMLHGVLVPDFTDHDHIRRFAQGVFQCIGIGMCINSDFTLVHQRFAMAVDKLDRVFNG